MNVENDCNLCGSHEPLYGYFWAELTSQQSLLMKRRSQRFKRLSHCYFNKFDNVSCTMMAKKPVKKCAACSEFLFCLFYSCAELASSITMWENFWYATICVQNRQFDEKHAAKWTSAVTHAEAPSSLETALWLQHRLWKRQ